MSLRRGSGHAAWLDRPRVRALAMGLFTYVITTMLLQLTEDLGFGAFNALTPFGWMVALVCASLAYHGGATAARAVRIAGVLALLAFMAAVVARMQLYLPTATP